MDQPSTSKACINLDFNSLNKSFGENTSQKNLRRIMFTTNNASIQILKDINIGQHHHDHNTNNIHMNTTIKSLLTYDDDDDDDEDNQYNSRMASSCILNEGSEDHFLSSAAIHNLDDYDNDNNVNNNSILITRNSNRSNHNDDEYDLNKIKKDALNLSDDTTNFDIVNNLNTCIYEYKRENSIDLGCDFVDNGFLDNKDDDNSLTGTKSCKYLEMVYDEDKILCNNNNNNSNNNNSNNNNSITSKNYQNNQNITKDNENRNDDDISNYRYNDNTETDNSSVSSILREHNYINLSQILLPPEKSLTSPSLSIELKKLNEINDKNDLKSYLEIIQKFLNNNNNKSNSNNNNDNSNDKNNDNLIVDKETLELAYTLLQRIISISKTNDKFKNNANNGNNNENNNEDNENNLLQSNLDLLLEACEIQDSANSVAAKITKIKTEAISESSEKAKKETSLNKIKIISDIKLEPRINTDDIANESTDDSSLPTIPDLDMYENDERNSLELENTKQNILKPESQEKLEKSIKSSTEKQCTTSEDVDTESLLFTENRSEPLEYDENVIINSNENDCIEKLSSSQGTNISNSKNKGNNENLQDLKLFAKNFYESCEKLCKSDSKTKGTDKEREENEKMNKFLMKKYYEFRNFIQKLNIEKNDYCSSIEVQTNITGGEIFKKRKRKLNEKIKKMLLSSSSSSSSDSEEDDDEDEDEDEREGDDEDGDNVFEQNHDGEENDKETNLLDDSEHETEPPYLIGGLDLSKCIENMDDDATDITNKLEKFDEENNKKEYNDEAMNEDDDDYDDSVLENIIECDVEVKSDDGYNDEIVLNMNEDFIRTKVGILDDEKLKMKPIVLIDKLSKDDLENYLDELRDKEIDRLLNFDCLMNPKTSHGHYTKKRKDEKRKKKVKESFDILDDIEKSSSSEDSSSDQEDKVMTEKEYLEKCNNNLKQQLLNTSSSSDSERDENDIISDSEDLKMNEEDKNILTDESENESELLVDKFLKKLAQKSDKAIENDENDDEEISKTNLESSLSDEEIQENKLNNIDKDIDDLENDKKSEEKLVKKCEINEENKNAFEENNKLNLKERKTSSDSTNSTLNDEKKTKKRFHDRIYDSTRKILTEKEFNIESFNSDETTPEKDTKKDNDDDDNDENDGDVDDDDAKTDSSDCEILNDFHNQRNKKKNLKPKSIETLVAESKKRKQNANNKSAEDLISLSSSSETELEGIPIEEEAEERKRVTKPMLRQDQLAGETRTAQKQESERIRRLEQKQKMMKKAFEKHKIKNDGISKNEFILDYDPDTDTFIKVHPDIVKHMKQHQFDGVKFMYDNCYGSVKDLKTHPGSGCILAHCMGLGKTFQLVALLHTVVTHKELNTSKVLILCPKSTVMNWCDEITHWLQFKKNCIKLFYFPDTSDLQTKLKLLKDWSECGSATMKKPGILLIGYEAFRTLISYRSNKNKRNQLTEKEKEILKQKIKKYLLEPGADLVICDEGHIIKNRKAAISTAVAEIKTPRRIILTGTPIQNNLKEYYSMVNFIKPSFLGTEREFSNLYANPIKNGQHKDSNDNDIKIMKQRSFVLHKKLTKFVQRKEAALLKSFLPEKFEYVLFIPMSEVQNRLYEYFLEATSKRQSAKGKSLIPDYTCLRKIWTHPKVLEIAWKNAIEKMKKEQQQNPMTSSSSMSSKVSTPTLNSDDELPDDVNDIQTGELSVSNDWWRPLITKEDLESLLPSNKLIVMFEILRMCEENKEKCLIFSAFVAVLNVVEYFMEQIDKRNHDFLNNSGFERFKGPWKPNKNYFRLDGKTSKTLRHQLVTQFNDPKNTTTRCFLISAKAGGQGINLIGANRVIILDTSWNPSNDQQNIFRIYRLGQNRKCYVYRLLSMGTMEEKVYSRSVTKQAMSFRVVDEQQIDRHYSMAELTELYKLTKPNFSERPVPALPQDVILANLLRNYPNLVYKYHEHDSLLENKIEQELSEKEKTEAWLQYERDLQRSQDPSFGAFDNQNMAYNAMRTGYNAGYPMPYGFGGLPLSNFNYGPGNPIFNLYNMYQNFPDYSALMSRLNHPNASSIGPFQSPYLTNFMQPPSSGLSAANILQSSTNGMPLGALDSFASLNTSPQRAHYNPTTSHMNAAAIGLYSPPPQPVPTAINSASTTNHDTLIADLKKFLESSPNTSILGPFDNTSAMGSRNQFQQPSSMSSSLNKLPSSSPLMSHSSSSASAVAAALLGSSSTGRSSSIDNMQTSSRLGSSSTGRNSSIDSIQTSVIRKPDLALSSSNLDITNSKINTIFRNTEIENSPTFLTRNYSTSGGSVQLSKSEQDISTTNSKSSSLLSNLIDQGKSIRPDNMGIIYPEKPSSVAGNANSTLSSSPLSTTATATGKKSTNISVRSVTSINENSNNKSPPSPIQSSSNNTSSFSSTNVKAPYQFSKPTKGSETPVSKNATSKVKPVSDVRSKTPLSTPKSPVNLQQMKNISKQNVSANSAAVTSPKTGGNKVPTQTSVTTSNLPPINLQTNTSSGNKNLTSSSSSSLTNTTTSAIPSTSQSSPPSLVISNRSNSSNTNAKMKAVNSPVKTSLILKNQKADGQNKTMSTASVITPLSSPLTTNNTTAAKQQTVNLPEMIRIAVGGKNYQQQATLLQNIKNNARSSTSTSPTSLSVTSNKQISQISNIKNQPVNVSQQKNTVNSVRVVSGPSPYVNKSKNQNSPAKNITAIGTGGTTTSNKMISSSGTSTNVNNSNSSSNQTITAHKNTLNSLNNRSDLSIRPIDNSNKQKSGVFVTTSTQPSASQKFLNPVAISEKHNNSGKTSITTPIITQVTSLNTSANKNLLSKTTLPVVSRKRPGTNIVSAPSSSEDLPSSVRQIKKPKQVLVKLSNAKNNVPDSFPRIQSAQSLSVLPKTSSKAQSSQLQKVVNEGKPQEVVEID